MPVLLMLSRPILAIVLLSTPLASGGEAGDYAAVSLGADSSGGLSSGGASPVSALSTFNIVIQPGSSLAGNSEAMAAFQRAANSWAAYISDPITVVIDADVRSFGTGQENVIGGTSSYLLVGGYSGLRDAMVADAAGDGNDSIVAALPTMSYNLNVQSMSGVNFSGNVLLTKANAKALGFSSSMLDGIVGTTTDAVIDFNSDFAFDYNRADGIAAGTIDFESVALHEIGHALGFISQTDLADQVAGFNGGIPYLTTSEGNVPLTQLDLTTLDLFRLAAGSQHGTASEFADAVRELTPGGEAVFFDGDHEYDLSTGVAWGDGRQASHWKDDGLTGERIGAMDPTIGYQQAWGLSEPDLRALDLIGYDIASLAGVPEPAAGILMGVAGCLMWRRRRAASE
ncbi:NF038122 family metalloprotease [Luteolibacter sp. LG18]|uniref:NF038122 family metalloprotease n=1 Tax=Luteolibacter sp. LG18 TaxID=2819286 RepID=UPI0030C75DA7